MSDDQPNKNGDLFVDGVKVGEVTGFSEHTNRVFNPTYVLEKPKTIKELGEMFDSFGLPEDRCFFSQERWDALVADAARFQQEYPLEPYFPKICPTCEKPTPCSHFRNLDKEQREPDAE